MTEREELEREIFESLTGSADNSIVTLKALDVACKIIDFKFGKDFHKKNLSATLQMTETLMKNVRMTDFKSYITGKIEEFIKDNRKN